MSASGTRRRHTRAALALVLGCSLQSTACYRYHVYQVGGPEGRELGDQPSTEWKSKTLHSIAWGAVRQDLPVDNCKLANGQRLGIEEIRIDSKVEHKLLTAITLGFWAPVQVSWRCAKPPVPTGTLP